MVGSLPNSLESGAARRPVWLVVLAVGQALMPWAAAGPLETSADAPGSEYLVSTWQPEDGLPQSTVTCAVQTRDGYLWLGTFDGLARFDGLRFTVFGAHNTPALKSNRILALLEDPAGGLWIGTEGGGVVHWHEGRWTTLTGWEGLAHDVVPCLAAGDTGEVWIGTLAGLSLARGGTLISLPESLRIPSPIRGIVAGRGTPAAVLSSGGLRWQVAEGWGVQARGIVPESRPVDGLHRGPSGTVWAFGKGLIIPLGTGTGTGVGATSPHRIPGALDPEIQIDAVLETRDGDLWAGTRRGALMRWRAGGWLTMSGDGRAGQYPVRCLLEDREHNVWAGTDGGGLVRLKTRRLGLVRGHAGSANESVLSLAPAPGGGVWMGAPCGGISHWQSGISRPFDGGGLLTSNACVRPMLRTRDGSLWIGTAGEGLYRWQPSGGRRYGSADGFPDADILSLFEDREGHLWIGTAESGVFRFHDGRFRNFATPDGFPARSITSLVQDPGGDLWIGSNGGGLYRYSGGKFSLYSRREGWGGDFIRTLHVDAEGALWIGSGGGGLTRMKDGWFHTIGSQEGLSDDVVSQILEDDFGNLWVGTNRGICRFHKGDFEALASGRSRSVAVVAYGKSDGMESLECTGGFHPAGLKTEDGALWFSTVKGAVRMTPEALIVSGGQDAAGAGRSARSAPSVVIEEVWSDGVRLLDAPRMSGTGPVPPRLVIHPDYKNLEIRYTAPTLTAPEKVRFRYRLEGLDTDWVDTGGNRTARFGKLPPGEYRFRVSACSGDGVWDEGDTGLGLVLRPHFWQRRWFLAGNLLAMAGLTAAGIRLRERRKLQRAIQALERQNAVEQERRRIAQDMHDELGSRLAKVSFLCELTRGTVDRPEEVAARVDGIARASRATLATLDEMVWAVNPQNDTLEHLAAYIGEYAKEFFQTTLIECGVRMPPSLDARPLPAEVRHHLFLAVQEALSNVLKHSGATRVQVLLSFGASGFRILIEDNGRGFPASCLDGVVAGKPVASPSGRNGLTNMRRRLEAIGAPFCVENRKEGGARVCLTLPLPPFDT